MAVTARNTFNPDVPGQEKVVADLAEGLAAWCHGTVDRIKALAPVDGGIHSRGGPQYEGKARRSVAGHYRDTIASTTYLKGRVIDGSEVQASGFDPAGGSDLHSIIYSASSVAHLLELTGAKPHDIPNQHIGRNGVAYFVTSHHPGFARHPHFVPGLLASAEAVGVEMRGKVRA